MERILPHFLCLQEVIKIQSLDPPLCADYIPSSPHPHRSLQTSLVEKKKRNGNMQKLGANTIVSVVTLVVCQQVNTDDRNKGSYGVGGEGAGKKRRKSRESCGRRLVGIPEASPRRLLVQGGPR